MILTDALAWLQKKPTFSRGIHPRDHKSLVRESPIEILPTPSGVLVPLQQHAGAPAQAVVKPRQTVTLGDLIGDGTSVPVSANIHASISGMVQVPVGTVLPNGRHTYAIPIKTSAASPDDNGTSNSRLPKDLFGGTWDVCELDRFLPGDITTAVRRAGIVGLGGAAFPTHMKLARDLRKPVFAVLLNGCECEPYLTSDYRLMLEYAPACVVGLKLSMKATGAEKGIIAVEDNKPEAVAALHQAIDLLQDIHPVELKVCQTKYPMGAERQLIPAVFGVEVPTGGYPLDLGIVVMNVGTSAAVASAVLRQQNMTHRVVTVTGRGIPHPKNILAPIGARFSDLLNFCGGLKEDARRVIAGGPMMGFTVTNLSTPVTKGTGGITVLSDADIAQFEQTACIRCGRCLDVCPLRLAPTQIAHAAKHGDLDLAHRYDLMACCECGCCAYVCPAHIPLAQHIRAGKSEAVRQRILKQRKREETPAA